MGKTSSTSIFVTLMGVLDWGTSPRVFMVQASDTYMFVLLAKRVKADSLDAKTFQESNVAQK